VGGTESAAPQADVELGFDGLHHDDELGLIDQRGRVYDPRIRHFLTPDPIVGKPLNGQSYNAYSYVLNDPTNLTDPSGFDPFTDGCDACSNYWGGASGALAIFGMSFGGGGGGAVPWAGNMRLFPGATAAPVFHQPASTPIPAAPRVAERRFVEPTDAVDMPLPSPGLPSVDFQGGSLIGLGLGYVPGGAIADQLAAAASESYRNKSADATLGKALGEMVGGLLLMAGGLGGETLGGAGSATGVGALVGVPVMVGSAVLVTAGYANFMAGALTLNSWMARSGSGGGETTTYPKDTATKNTKDYSAKYPSERAARSFARTKIGSDPVEIEPGKLRSQDGRWQYRAKPNDLVGHGTGDSPHVHLERLDPITGEVLENWHLRW
jgi:RHS repeat-associated protein